MNAAARRVASIVVAVGLAATLVMTAGTPALAKKPGDNGKGTKTGFAITVEIVVWSPYYIGGPFKARGAIRDAGPASCDYPTQRSPLTLQGKKGNIYIDWGETSFLITGATGNHVHAIGATGSTDIRVEWSGPPEYPVATYHLTFEGSIPQ
jgi:hypothetical protein